MTLPLLTVEAALAYNWSLAASIAALIASLIVLAAFLPRIPWLDRFEEILIASLIGLATVLIFIAVTHRYSQSAAISLVNLGKAYKLAWLTDASTAAFKTLRLVNLTWAQELCIYMFVWMAKFGAALGVRQGIHVGVDVLTNMLGSRSRRIVVLFALLCGALFTGVVGSLGSLFVFNIAQTDQTSPDLELPMWFVYLAIPLGSFLMCFRFLQVFFSFLRGEELPGHHHAHVVVPGSEVEEMPA